MIMNDNVTQKNFLFLQGPHGPFFSRMAAQLEKAGHAVRRILLNGGDRADWGEAPADAYTGAPEDWENYLADYLRRHKITDIVFYGYWRHYHQAAIRLARQEGIALHGFEEGLLRPHWITVSPQLPCEHADEVKEKVLRKLERQPDAAAEAPAAVQPQTIVRHANWWMIYWCIRYYIGYFRYKEIFSRYRTHRPWPPAAEGRMWFWQLLLYPWRKMTAKRRLAKVLRQSKPFYLLCLQLDGDSQIRQYSGYGGMRDVLEEVVPAFARHAANDALLVVKSHPLDNGAGRLHEACRALAVRYGLQGRIVFLPYGKLAGLLKGARGLVNVNSTTGLQALFHQCPVKTLGRAVYSIPGLVDTQDWEGFFTKPQVPLLRPYNALHDVLVSASQYPGGFYAPAGIPDTIRNCLPVLLAPRPAAAQPAERAEAPALRVVAAS